MKVTSKLQYKFVKDVISLLVFALDMCEEGVYDRFTLGEVWRRPETQKILLKRGWTKTLSSRHIDKLAIDIFFWQDGKFISNVPENREKLEDMGNYWESRHPMNIWGGHFNSLIDINHYERSIR
jgi:hypothetical protein